MLARMFLIFIWKDELASVGLSRHIHPLVPRAKRSANLSKSTEQRRTGKEAKPGCKQPMCPAHIQ